MTQSAPFIHTETITSSTGAVVSFRMIPVEGGVFAMGGSDKGASSREKPVHEVNVPDFWMGEFLVTQALWLVVMGENPAHFPGLDRPVEQVSWNDVTNRFLPVLNVRCQQHYRLPTEAEWEYAARGGKHQSPYLYAGSNRMKDVGWYAENSHNETKQVGLKQPNTLGLYDMSGNVYEWCADWYDENYYQTCVDRGIIENPSGPTQGRSRVLRGGSWDSGHPKTCRLSFRHFDEPGYVFKVVGFRVVLSPV